MNRGIEMRSAVLGREEIVRRVVSPCGVTPSAVFSSRNRSEVGQKMVVSS